MSERNYGAIRDAEKLEAFVEKMIDSGKPIGFDIEAGYTGPDAEGISLLQFHPNYILVGISFTVSTEWARYVPIAHDDGNNINDIPRVARALWRMLQTGMGVAHNLSYELKGLSRWFREVLWDDPDVGAEVQASLGFFPFRSDTMIEVFLSAEYDPLRIGKDLKSVSLDAFGLVMTKFKDLFPPTDSDLGPATPRGKIKYIRFNTRNSNSPTIINYACEDSVAALMVHEKHYEAFAKDFIFRTEMALLPVLVEMEMEGMYLDWNTISQKATEILEFKNLMNEEILQELSERLGRVININLQSVPQLSGVLYGAKPEGLGLPVKKRSDKTGDPSTGEEALRAIAKADPVIKQILEWREVSKLYNSYLHKYDTELNYAGTGRAYPNHNQAGALTGRLSVDGVSYQQWPKPYHYELRTGKTFDLNFRDLLISPNEFRVVGYDFSQVELRVLAGMANERALLQAFADDVDIHKATASQMMGIPLESVTKKQRAQGKTLNFAVVYGSGAANIADMLTTPDAPITPDDAQELLNKYFAAFSGLKAWMDTKVAEGREQGFVHTLFGRRFTVWEYKDHREWIRSKGDRMCVNAPVQGGAADYMKIGMVRAQRAIKAAGMQDKIRLIMTVHDALEFYVHDSVSTQQVIDLIQPAVTFPVQGLPFIRADWHEGKSWGSVVEIKLDKKTKQIASYALDDVDDTFATIEEAYAYQEKVKIQKEAERVAKLAEAKAPEETSSWKDVEPDLTGDMEQRIETAMEPGADTPDEAVKIEISRREANGESVIQKKNLAGLVPSGDLMDIELEEQPEPEPEGEPEWQHGAEWHAENDQPMAFALQKVSVIVTEMPDEDQWTAFKSFLDARPGRDTVVFSTPAGEMVMDTKHSLTKEHQPQLSLILGGASMTFTVDTVDADLVTEGLDL